MQVWRNRFFNTKIEIIYFKNYKAPLGVWGMKKDITIIGAGLVGSLLSIYLAKRGHKVSVYERRSDMRNEELSAGRSINLALSDRGLLALEKDLYPNAWPANS